MTIVQNLGVALVAWGLALAPEAHAMEDVQVRVLVDPSLAGTIGTPIEVTVEATIPVFPMAGDDYFAAERRGRKQLVELFREPAFSQENLDYSWQILEPGELVIERVVGPAEGSSSMLVGRALWKIASLEAGERRLPGILWSGFDLPELDPQITAGFLGEADQAPRPLAGFPDTPPEREPQEGSPLRLLWVGAGLGAALVGVLILRRGSSEPSLTPRERQVCIDQSFADLVDLVAPGRQPTPDDLRDAHFTLTACLREAVELKRELAQIEPVLSLGVALTDHEWAHALGAPDEVHDFFAAIGMIKYAGDVPTPWGLAERIALAKKLQDKLAESVPAAPQEAVS